MMSLMMMRFIMIRFINLIRCLVCLIPTFQPPLYLSCSLVHRQTGGSKSKTLDMSLAISRRLYMICKGITLVIRKLPTHKVAAGKVAAWVDMTDRLLMDMADSLLSLLDITGSLLNLLVLSLPPTSLMHILSLSRARR